MGNLVGNGKLASEIAYYGNLKHGDATIYYESGFLKFETTFEYDVLTGDYTGYHDVEDAQVSESGKHVSGKRQGLWTDWTATGTKIKEANYHLGTLDGTSTTFHALDGSIDTISNFKNGQPDGKYVRYHFPGPLTPVDELVERGPRVREQEIGQHAKGHRVGNWELYYPTGNLQSESVYDDAGLKTGLWYYYNELNEVSTVEKYDANQLIDGIADCRSDRTACETFH
ncbi:hypothetical protein [uncultured Shimia sp.]|uniref:toxin-antitoxin system YwqK family antitoxin n=1 Tax=uncultured Shimia sp. TaxID=573152 RepID=UPI00263342D4|nr:hypothetical protein [uncultured Shimia sp.]